MNELVVLKDKKAVTTSRVVADVFEKRHDAVLRDIRNVIETINNIEENIGVHNFQLSHYTSEQNKQMPMYEMNRDGFMLLVMGFTGERAMKMKLAFIDAFNKMEELLRTNIPKTYLEALEPVAGIDYDTSVCILHPAYTHAF